jgi:hypothetical protein
VHDDGGWLAIDTPMPHNLKIGDSVLIEQDKPIFGSSCVEVRLADPNYNGVAIVTKIPSDKVFVLNKKFTNKNPYQIGSFKLNTSFSKI